MHAATDGLPFSLLNLHLIELLMFNYKGSSLLMSIDFLVSSILYHCFLLQVNKDALMLPSVKTCIFLLS